jgi:hypothetical protein
MEAVAATKINKKNAITISRRYFDAKSFQKSLIMTLLLFVII